MGDSKQQAVSAINSIPFGNIIGGPLSAAVYAQGDAAQTTINYLQSAMMQQSDFEAGASEPVTVTFSFFKDGTRMQMAVPLLTLVPLPYMHIDDLNISFTADITGCENGKIEARYSSASRSEEVATETETTMQALIDVSVHASTQHMPPGMAKLLQVFGDQLVKVEDVSVEELEEKWAEKERKSAQCRALDMAWRILSLVDPLASLKSTFSNPRFLAMAFAFAKALWFIWSVFVKTTTMGLPNVFSSPMTSSMSSRSWNAKPKLSA